MILTVEVLRQILDHVPDDYEIEYLVPGRNSVNPVSDKVEVDVSGKKIILKS